METKSDVELLTEHLAGKPGAFEKLVSRYSDELYGFLCRFVGNAAAAEDILQDAFVQVHLAADSFDTERPFKPWLYTIAANKARDYLRARARRQVYSLDSGGLGEDGPTAAQMVESVDESLAEQVADDEQRKAVREVVDQMPERLRLVLVLGYFQQLPYAQIAEILDIPVGTVKSRLHAAVKHFARLWKARTERTEG